MPNAENQREIVRVANAGELARRAMDLIVEQAAQAMRLRGRFTIALAGGSTPRRTYELLAAPEAAGRVDWREVFVFFGDERFVSAEDDRSNYKMAREALLGQVPIPISQVFPMTTDSPSAAQCANRYEQTLREFFQLPLQGAGGDQLPLKGAGGLQTRSEPPRIDLILLGLGDDGHTASLFPGDASLLEREHWVVGTPPGVLPPPVDRITMTYPILNAARCIAFLVSGKAKASAVRDILEGDAAPRERPAAGIRPASGSLYWLIDDDAGYRLARA